MNDFAFSIDLARQLDPTLIAADCGYKLDKWQAELMRSVSRRVLMLCSRQCGKTTTAGFMGLHKAVYSPGSLVLIVSPSQRQSGEMLRSIMANYRKLTGVPEIKDESVLRVEFRNGSRLIALHGEERTLRGYAGANLIILDEAARVPDELISALTPMLATSNGSFIALSTPAGCVGFFYEAWVGKEEWTRVQVSAEECPRISKEFLAEERARMGPLVYSQEYSLKFVSTSEAMWSEDVIQATFEDFPTMEL